MFARDAIKLASRQSVAVANYIIAMAGDGEGHLTAHNFRVQKPIAVCFSLLTIHLLQWFCQMIDLNHQAAIIFNVKLNPRHLAREPTKPRCERGSSRLLLCWKACELQPPINRQRICLSVCKLVHDASVATLNTS